MTSPKSKWSTYLENAKNVAEIIAFLVTGAWVLFLFILKDYPAYNKTLKLTGDLRIDSIEIISKKNFCQANLTLDAKNLRPSSIVIDTLQIKLWYFSLDALPKNGFVDLKYFESNKNLFYQHYHFLNAITSYYPVDGDAHEDLQFLVDNDKTKGLICEYTAIGHTNNILTRNDRIEVFGTSWLFKCSPEPAGVCHNCSVTKE